MPIPYRSQRLRTKEKCFHKLPESINRICNAEMINADEKIKAGKNEVNSCVKQEYKKNEVR